MDNLKNYITIVAVVFGVISALSSIILKIRDVKHQNKLLKELKKEQLKSILNSSDIIALGNYLDNDIGKLSISHYVDNEKINRMVDSLISTLTRFVRTDKEIELETTKQEKFEKEIIEQEVIKKFPFKGRVSKEFDKIIDELYIGERWNALSRLRRYVEILLKEIGRKNGIIRVDQIYSLSKLIDILHGNDLIDDDVVNSLKYPIYVSNRAVHGEELKQGETEKSILYAAYAIKKLIKKNRI